MKYKLIKNSKPTGNIVYDLLANRGVDASKYLYLDSSCVGKYTDLDNINEAVQLLLKHVNKESNILIVVDDDVDGYTSGAMMYKYLIKMGFPQWNLDYQIHYEKKSHGLSSGDIVVDDNVSLVIIPDAGSNDVKECEELSKRGIDVLILDHHEIEFENKYAVIVNNQASKNYSNKELCGAGVVYRFLEAVDDEMWTNYYEEFIDLCALGNISDDMDLTSYETKYLVDLGLKNINSKMFQAFIKAQSFSMKDVVNIHNVQWYVTPIINAMIRFGSYEEKLMMFRGFIETDEVFDYKSKTKGDVKETIYERVARLCCNAKSRQDKAKKKATETIISDGNVSVNDKVFVDRVDKIVDKSLTGLVAMNVADRYGMPCILVRQFGDTLSGSARNIDGSSVSSLKDVVNSCESIEWAMGHANAFGLCFKKGYGIDEVKKELNEKLKDVVYDSSYYVDFIFDSNDVNVGVVKQFEVMTDLICKGISEPLIAVENINVYSKFEREDSDFAYVIGKQMNTVCFTINDVKYIKFNLKEDDELLNFASGFSDKKVLKMNIVGKPMINVYEGVVSPQIVIEDYELIN